MQNKKPRNDNGMPHGNWETYYDNRQLSHKGFFIDGRRNGFHESYYENGNVDYKGNFINGEVYGYWEEHWVTKIDKEYHAR
jgi:antitoxin component YwqK of YwqJK toxin-antitoxin module